MKLFTVILLASTPVSAQTLSEEAHDIDYVVVSEVNEGSSTRTLSFLEVLRNVSTPDSEQLTHRAEYIALSDAGKALCREYVRLWTQPISRSQADDQSEDLFRVYAQIHEELQKLK